MTSSNGAWFVYMMLTSAVLGSALGVVQEGSHVAGQMRRGAGDLDEGGCSTKSCRLKMLPL